MGNKEKKIKELLKRGWLSQESHDKLMELNERLIKEGELLDEEIKKTEDARAKNGLKKYLDISDLNEYLLPI